MSHVAVIAGFIPQAGSKDDVANILQGMVGPTRAEPGCLQYDLYESEDGFHLFERYDDGEAIAAHQATEHYRAYREAIVNLLVEPVSVVVAAPVDVE